MKKHLLLVLGCIGGVLFLIGCAAKGGVEVEEVTATNVRVIHLTRPKTPKTAKTIPATHQVKQGESLFSIARRYDLDYRQLARWNQIEGNYVIKPGQELVIRPDADASGSAQQPAAPAVAAKPPQQGPKKIWKWPTKNRPDYTKSDDRKGLIITTSKDGAVLAVRDGSVVYAGAELKEYGKMVLISHADGFLTVYAQNAELLVKEGQRVARGARIATADLNASGGRNFYFEIRQGGKVADAARLLEGS